MTATQRNQYMRFTFNQSLERLPASQNEPRNTIVKN